MARGRKMTRQERVSLRVFLLEKSTEGKRVHDEQIGKMFGVSKSTVHKERAELALPPIGLGPSKPKPEKPDKIFSHSSAVEAFHKRFSRKPRNALELYRELNLSREKVIGLEWERLTALERETDYAIPGWKKKQIIELTLRDLGLK